AVRGVAPVGLGGALTVRGQRGAGFCANTAAVAQESAAAVAIAGLLTAMEPSRSSATNCGWCVGRVGEQLEHPAVAHLEFLSPDAVGTVTRRQRAYTHGIYQLLTCET